jgi:signal transduction histidine kinase
MAAADGTSPETERAAASEPEALPHHTVSSDAVATRLLEDAARAVARARELEQKLLQLAGSLPSLEERAIRVVETALTELGAKCGVAAQVTADGAALEIVGSAYVPNELLRPFHRVSIDAPMPIAEVARTGRPSYCESRHQVLTRYPEMRETVEALDLHALATVPVRHLSRVNGAVLLGFARARHFGSSERAMLRALGGRYARALHQAQRYFAEHDARTAVEAADRARSDYLAVVSHELRTPLQAMLGYAELLVSGVGGELLPRQREYVTRIAGSGMTLLHLIENVLGFSAEQSGTARVDLEHFELRALVEDVVVMFEPLVARKPVTLRAEIPVPVPMHSDPHRIRQILTNLVGNAIKFTMQGEVVVTITAVGAAGERVRIDVRDTGVGIDPHDLPRVFDPFWRAEQRYSAAGGGTGLGLNIVQRIALLLGGTVTVASRAGVGTTFTVELPRAAPER